MAKVIEFRSTYSALLKTVKDSGFEFNVAGTLDGFVDLAITDRDGHRIYNISCNGARSLAAALLAVAEDIDKNCLYERDALLERTR